MWNSKANKSRSSPSHLVPGAFQPVGNCVALNCAQINDRQNSSVECAVVFQRLLLGVGSTKSAYVALFACRPHRDISWKICILRMYTGLLDLLHMYMRQSGIRSKVVLQKPRVEWNFSKDEKNSFRIRPTQDWVDFDLILQKNGSAHKVSKIFLDFPGKLRNMRKIETGFTLSLLVYFYTE